MERLRAGKDSVEDNISVQPRTHRNVRKGGPARITVQTITMQTITVMTIRSVNQIARRKVPWGRSMGAQQKAPRNRGARMVCVA